ncbi:hypothetical protein O6H91_04G025400 [Diphasiastrum complanatum]|uniref:Uncharacterized protein n=1 Tax=Diphasiastrum complanatum TaxID=34168 RepID=A0ACC2DVF2_DIPCM|nr:hypothetical protein O6H91_04G025400 [Diphasiastrum complanatum]
MSRNARFKIGYALTEKKQQSLLQPKFLEYAKSRGVDFIRIEVQMSLLEQGPFEAILHKLRDPEWNKQLSLYEMKHPEVIVIDPPEAIKRLHNRISMLQAVAEIQVSDGLETFGIPKQVVVDKSETLNDSRALAALKFPVIAKPLVADGSARSHAMSLVFHPEGLAKLKPPLVIQEFVNHGGVIFKVYVVGEHVKCVRRRSLPDVGEDEIPSCEAPLSFSQISNVTSSTESDIPVDSDILQAELPPFDFISGLAKGLRIALGLRLFNFDLIRDIKAGNHYHVIDINYFPGYAKMPAYESVLTDFFVCLAKEQPRVTVETA